MKLFTILFLVAKQTCSLAVYAVSYLFPRNKKVWLYGNLKGSFRDNAKYLFIYNSVHHSEIKHIWISQSKSVIDEVQKLGFRAVYKFSPHAFWYALTAKVYIYNAAPTDTVHGCMRGKAYCFNLWHGVPFKKIEYDITKGSFYKDFFNPTGFKKKFESFLFEPKIFRNSDGVLATSSKLTSVFCSAFKVKPDQIFIGPYPRNELFKLSPQELNHFITKYEGDDIRRWVNVLSEYENVVIYMPTFRDENPDFMQVAIKDFKRLNDVCKTSGTLFLIKAHMLTRFNVDLSKFENIKMLDNHIDVYPLLPYTHALISDYSSIIFDYSLLNKQIFFYAYDLEEYLSQSRESYFKYEDVFSSDIIHDFEALLQNIQSIGKVLNYEYSEPKSFLQNDCSMADITAHLNKMINS